MTEEEEKELLRKHEREATDTTLRALRARAAVFVIVVRNISKDAISCPLDSVRAIYNEIVEIYSRKLYELNVIIDELERSIQA